MKIIDLTGNTYGKLYVQCRVGSDKNGQSIFTCLCECGNTKNLLGNSLKYNLVKSCGCLITRKNFIGSKIGLLTVISKIKQNKPESKSIYLCKCDCGNEKEVVKKSLLSEQTKSCGCLKFKTENEINFDKLILSNARVIYRATYNDGDISFDDFLLLSRQNCHYCGSAPSNVCNVFKNKSSMSKYSKSDKTNFVYNGLDRVDSKFKHLKNNVVPCCAICNRMKRELSLEKFQKHIKLIYNFYINKGNNE